MIIYRASEIYNLPVRKQVECVSKIVTEYIHDGDVNGLCCFLNTIKPEALHDQASIAILVATYRVREKTGVYRKLFYKEVSEVCDLSNPKVNEWFMRLES